MNSNYTIQTISTFIKKTFEQNGFSNAVIGVSGGIDSAVSCSLAVKALGKERIYPLLLPYGELNQKGVEDGLLLTSQLGIPKKNLQVINIQPIVDSFSVEESIRKGNIMARVRMTILFDQAKAMQALVVGTENKTEHYLGYYTRFGDEASDIEPIRNVYKTQVYDLATELGVPEPILIKAPTAGLWEGQTDEMEFGFTYKEADNVLRKYVDEQKSREQIIETGVDPLVVDKIVHRLYANSFKHKLPHIPE